MTEQSEKDLKWIKDIDEKIQSLNKTKKGILSNCKHSEKEAKLVETLRKDYSARLVCVVCGEQFGRPSPEVEDELWVDFFLNYECFLMANKRAIIAWQNDGYTYP